MSRYAIRICGGPEPLVASECSGGGEHTPAPRGYLAWHEWAEEQSKTHRQKRCPGCGLFAAWIPKGRAT